jgi:hypothetical protein
MTSWRSSGYLHASVENPNPKVQMKTTLRGRRRPSALALALDRSPVTDVAAAAITAATPHPIEEVRTACKATRRVEEASNATMPDPNVEVVNCARRPRSPGA